MNDSSGRYALGLNSDRGRDNSLMTELVAQDGNVLNSVQKGNDGSRQRTGCKDFHCCVQLWRFYGEPHNIRLR
jgi:hypothetical protein